MIDPEIEKFAIEFRDELAASIAANISIVIKKNSSKIDEAYARLTCLQAVKVYLLDGHSTDGALGFFTEAQGDGLTSQVLILSGSSRSALKSLRSLIENAIRAVYYADHPIEYRLWEEGRHRPTFRSLFEYLNDHPDLKQFSSSMQPSTSLYSNWKKLSQSVHASAKDDRMSSSTDKIEIWKTNQKSVGQWAKFQNNVIKDICLLYLALHHKKLQGATLKPLRGSFAIAFPTSFDTIIAKTFGITILRN